VSAAGIGGDWLDALVRQRDRGVPATLVSVVSTKGSVPRTAGTRMVVTADSVEGTIGGGHLEFSAIDVARAMLSTASAQPAELRRFPLGASLGQCCGGLVNLLFEPIDADADWVHVLASLRHQGIAVVVATPAERTTPGRVLVTSDRTIGSLGDRALDASVAEAARALLAGGGPARLARFEATPADPGTLVFLDPLRDSDFEIVLFGAGHVARALVAVLAGIACRVTWIDERETEFPAVVPANINVVVTDTSTSEVASAASGAYFLVMTHSHALDQALAEAILRRGDFAYFGLIGSRSKRRQFERRMVERGIPPERFGDMTCPIGVPGIAGKEPATIAIAVAAELLQVRERRASQRCLGSAAAGR
jgi:xanthine dehydrogenase accessory factor